MNSDNQNNNFNESNDSRVRLRVLGISYSQIQSGAYALILADVNGPLRMPIVVGGVEAQSIAMRMERVTPPRPLTHDLFVSLMQAYGLQMVEVFIYRFEDGVFSSEITFLDLNGQEVKLDARTSDAIAIAMRTDAPIFTTPEILNETGFTMEITTADDSDDDSDDGSQADNPESDDTSESSEEDTQEALNKKIAALRAKLAKAVEAEEYEEAARLTSEISSLESRLNP